MKAWEWEAARAQYTFACPSPLPQAPTVVRMGSQPVKLMYGNFFKFIKYIAGIGIAAERKRKKIESLTGLP